MSDPTYQGNKGSKAKNIFLAYWKHLRQYPFSITLVLIGVSLVQAANLIAPLYLKQFFNILAANTPNPSALTQLTEIIAVIAFLWVVRWVGNRMEHFTNVYMESRIMADILSDTFHQLINHSYNFFISNFAGSLTHKVNKFARSFETLFDSFTLQFIPTLIFIIGAIAVLFARNVLLGLLLCIWVLGYLIFQTYVTRRHQPLRNRRAEADTRTTGALADSISNHTTTILFSGVSFEHKRFTGVVQEWRSILLESWLSDAWIWAGIGLFMMVIEIGLLYGASVLWGRGLLTLGDFVLIQAYLITLFERLIAINRDLRRFYDAYSDASEMVGILQTPYEITDVPHARTLVPSDGTVEFKNVNFYFNPTRPIFQDFNVYITAREKIALVGPSGAGKTTITKLLLRLYDIKNGSIEIDGQNIAKVTQESLRNAIAFVPQEPILFHRTLMENIRYGRREATDGEVIEAAKKAHCHEFISDFPDKYDTYVGERGVRLSGGERQRVAIARAILKNAPILILDEATSSLDSESEALIQDALAILMEGKTVVVIAHRLSTIMKMDRIVVIEGGKIVAEGTHDELLQQGGLYQKLWSIQAGGFLADGGNNDEPPILLEDELENGEEEK